MFKRTFIQSSLFPCRGFVESNGLSSIFFSKEILSFDPLSNCDTCETFCSHNLCLVKHRSIVDKRLPTF